MRIQADQAQVTRLIATLREVARSDDGWTRHFVDPVSLQQWRQIYLGGAHHGGGMPILVQEPMPGVRDLLQIAADASDPAEVAAAAWLLAEVDSEGGYKEALVSIAERAANQDDHARAGLLVGWGELASEMNLRPALGKPPVEVSNDHEHFKNIAVRARRLLLLTNADPLLRDPRVFRGGSA